MRVTAPSCRNKPGPAARARSNRGDVSRAGGVRPRKLLDPSLGMKQRVFSSFRQHGRLLLAMVLGAGLLATLRPGPVPRTRVGLTQMLQQAQGGRVDGGQLVWQPSAGLFADLMFGRGLFFLAAKNDAEPRDLYHAYVRLAPSGQPLSLNRLRNLTQTPLGDETALRGNGRYCVFATVAFDAVQSLTLLDSVGLSKGALPARWLDRLLARISSFQHTGSFSGFARSDIVLDPPPREVSFAVEQTQLTVHTEEARRDLTLDLPALTLRGVSGEPPLAARLLQQHQGAKPVLIWAVDAVREELGPQAVAWLQRALFGAKDRLKRTAYSMVADDSSAALSSSEPSPVPTPTRALSWPPEPIRSIWANPDADEGRWLPYSPAWLSVAPATAAGTAPPAFFKTYLRPDRNRPYARLVLVAMDMRQLELGMQAGYEDPRPVAGPPGSGRLPDDAAGDLVAVFNGAFKTSHGGYGMMVQGRTLVPARPGAASIVIDRSGDVGFGSWPEGAEPEGLVAFRQNLDPLVAGFKVNPSGRSEWGERLAGSAVLTQRTALCLNADGQLLYAWGEEIGADTLAQALQRAGCQYAVHLDMNPKHCGFALAAFLDGERQELQFEIADRGMDINPVRMATYSPKDYFYLTRFDPTPPALNQQVWQVSPGRQPDPGWMPGIFASEVRLGSLAVTLWSLDRGRVDFRLRSGTREPRAAAGRPPRFELSEEEHEAALLAVNLGHATRGTEYGMAFAGEASLPLRGDNATLVVSKSGLRLVMPAESLELSAHDAAVQLPVLAAHGRISERAGARGSRLSRAALCLHPDGRVLLAMAENDSSDVLALALLGQGCSDVLELDRGSHHAAFVHRSGGKQALLDGYETSVLYVLDTAMRPHTFQWGAAGR